MLDSGLHKCGFYPLTLVKTENEAEHCQVGFNPLWCSVELFVLEVPLRESYPLGDMKAYSTQINTASIPSER